MDKIEVKFKKLYPDSVLPYYATEQSNALDCTVHSYEYDQENNCFNYKLGFAVEIPEGYVGLVFSRSSIFKLRSIQSNSVGVIDKDYRGEVSVKLVPDNTFRHYNVGERCCQFMIVPCPTIKVLEVDELSKTDRGEGGYGSTGN